MEKDQKIYYVGRMVSENILEWELQGIFSDKEKALKECTDESLFISTISLNMMLPLESVSREDFNDRAWFPMLQTELELYGNET